MEIISLAPSRLALGNICGVVSARADRALAAIKISYRRLLPLELSFKKSKVTYLFYNCALVTDITVLVLFQRLLEF